MAKKKPTLEKRGRGRPQRETAPTTFAERVGALVRHTREKKSKTAAEAAHAADVPLATWYHYEAGRITLESLPRIAAALGCAVKALIPD